MFISDSSPTSIRGVQAGLGIFEKTWLTSSEAASYLGRSMGSVRNMVYRGQLRPRKMFGRLYFSRLEIDRQISQGSR